MEKGGHEKITSDPRLRLKVDHHNLRTDKGEPPFDPERFKTDYQVQEQWLKLRLRTTWYHRKFATLGYSPTPPVTNFLRILRRRECRIIGFDEERTLLIPQNVYTDHYMANLV